MLFKSKIQHTMNEVFIYFWSLQDFSLPKLLVMSEFNGQFTHELTCKKGEIILLISKTIPGYVVDTFLQGFSQKDVLTTIDTSRRNS